MALPERQPRAEMVCNRPQLSVVAKGERVSTPNIPSLTPVDKLPEVQMPSNMVFDVNFSLDLGDRAPIGKPKAESDDGLAFEVISFEEKAEAKNQSNLTSMAARIEAGVSKVISFFAQSEKFIRDNNEDFNNVKLKQAQVAMQRARDCLADGQHVNNAISNSISTISSGEVTIGDNSPSIGGHESSGSHGHCKHKKDYGKCEKGCQPPAQAA